MCLTNWCINNLNIYNILCFNMYSFKKIERKDRQVNTIDHQNVHYQHYEI
jgi:hypothetical protein